MAKMNGGVECRFYAEQQQSSCAIQTALFGE